MGLPFPKWSMLQEGGFREPPSLLLFSVASQVKIPLEPDEAGLRPATERLRPECYDSARMQLLASRLASKETRE